MAWSILILTYNNIDFLYHLWHCHQSSSVFMSQYNVYLYHPEPLLYETQFFPVESKYTFVHNMQFITIPNVSCAEVPRKKNMTPNNVPKIRKTVLDLRKNLIYTVVNTKKL